MRVFVLTNKAGDFYIYIYRSIYTSSRSTTRWLKLKLGVGVSWVDFCRAPWREDIFSIEVSLVGP